MFENYNAAAAAAAFDYCVDGLKNTENMKLGVLREELKALESKGYGKLRWRRRGNCCNFWDYSNGRPLISFTLWRAGIISGYILTTRGQTIRPSGLELSIICFALFHLRGWICPGLSSPRSNITGPAAPRAANLTGRMLSATKLLTAFSYEASPNSLSETCWRNSVFLTDTSLSSE